MIDSAVLQREVSKLLSGADLNATTSKKVRTELERRLRVDLSDRKREIDAAIQAALEEANNGSSSTQQQQQQQGEQENAENDVDDDDDTDSSLSDLGDDAPPPPRRVKKSAAGRSGPQAKRPKAEQQQQRQLSDEELARQLHLEENGLPRSRRSAATAGSASASGKRAKKATAAGGRRSGGGGGFSKPCALSPALASVVGCDSMPRQQVVKRLWDIAKERDLFDPKNKQFVICDAEFEQLFGKKRLRMFALMKYLKSHVRNVD